MGLGRCFPDSVFQAVHHAKGMVSSLTSPGGKATFSLPQGFVSPPGWLLSAPCEDPVSKELVGDLAGDLRASHCPPPVAPIPEPLVHLRLHLLWCTMEAESARHGGQSQGVSTDPLQPLLPVFSSSVISSPLGLFQLAGEEEVSSSAQPDIYFYGSREPSMPCARILPFGAHSSKIIARGNSGCWRARRNPGVPALTQPARHSKY